MTRLGMARRSAALLVAVAVMAEASMCSISSRNLREDWSRLSNEVASPPLVVLSIRFRERSLDSIYREGCGYASQVESISQPSASPLPLPQPLLLTLRVWCVMCDGALRVRTSAIERQANKAEGLRKKEAKREVLRSHFISNVITCNVRATEWRNWSWSCGGGWGRGEPAPTWGVRTPFVAAQTREFRWRSESLD